MRALALVGALALFGCDDPNVHAAAQTAAYQFMPDGSDPAVQDKVSSVLTDGVVEAEIECKGVAHGGPGGIQVYYHASKLQDGSCLATVNLTGPAPVGPGTAQSNATRLTRRSVPNADTCPVVSFHVPQLRSDTSVSGGVIRVESPFCGATPCQMLVSTNCTGLNIGRF